MQLENIDTLGLVGRQAVFDKGCSRVLFRFIVKFQIL